MAGQGRRAGMAVIILTILATGPLARAAGTAAPAAPYGPNPAVAPNPASDPAKAPAPIWVRVRAAAGTAPWKARAIEATLWTAVSSYERLSPAKAPSPDPAFACGIDETDCYLRARRSHGVRIVILGKLEGRKLALRSYETRLLTQVAERTIDLGAPGASLATFRNQLYRLIRPFTTIGGILDQEAAIASEPPAPPAPVQRRTGLLRWAWLFPLALVFWLPRLGTALIARRKGIRIPRSRAWRQWTIGVGLALIVGSTALVFSPPLWAIVRRLLENAHQLRYFIGGAAWAMVAVLGIRFAVPGLRGTENASYYTIFPILRAWIPVVLARTAVLGLAWAPWVALASEIARWMSLDHVTKWGIAAPIAITAGSVWYLLWIGELSLWIDTQLAPEAADRQPWHQEIRKYFRGYMNRLGIELDERLLARTLFLPGVGKDAILTYGGGFARPRIVVPTQLLQFALGSLPDRDAIGGSGETFADFKTGSVFPKRKKKKSESGPASFWRELRLPSWISRRRKAAARAREMAAGRLFNRQNATILGYVLPAPPEVTVPLIANNREDFDVVASLLTEHYAQFDKEQEDHELDDTDPTDKDFLFGALLRELGVIENRDTLLTTFYLGFALASPTVPQFLWRIYDSSFSKHPNLLADYYAALNSGRNHLVQYLHLLNNVSREELTARASASELYAVARQMLKSVEDADFSDRMGGSHAASPRNRMIWLSEFFYGSLEQPRRPRRARLLTAFAAASLLLATGASYVFEAWFYHPVYQERMQRIRSVIERQKQEQERIHGGS